MCILGWWGERDREVCILGWWGERDRDVVYIRMVGRER